MQRRTKITGKIKVPATTAEQLELLARALREAYPTDPTTPSIVIGFVPSPPMYWVSLKRYKAIYANGGYNILSVKAETLDIALKQAIKQFVNAQRPLESALDSLEKFI